MTGVGMDLGHLSVQLFYIIGIGIVVLGAVLAYGMWKSGKLNSREKNQLEHNTRLAQERDDPNKTPSRP